MKHTTNISRKSTLRTSDWSDIVSFNLQPENYKDFDGV